MRICIVFEMLGADESSTEDCRLPKQPGLRKVNYMACDARISQNCLPCIQNTRHSLRGFPQDELLG